jgi:hypothetical protein
MGKRLPLCAFAVAFVVAACGRNEPPPPLVLDPPEAIPLAWRDANTLIVGYRGSIHRYDLGTTQLGQRLADSYDSVGFQGASCFRPEGGRFAVLPPEVTTRNGVTTTTVPKGQRYRHVPDWSRPDQYVEDAELVAGWSTNPLDCSRFDYKARARKVAAMEHEGLVVRSPRPLVLARDGEAFLTVPRGTDRAGGRVLQVSRHGADALRELPLFGATDALPDANVEVRSFLDPDGSYVVYEATRVFDANRGAWPLTAWRLGPDLAAAKALTLPPGPWIEPHGFFKQLSCFSCGCSCYSHFELDGAQGRIYAHVHGKSVEDSAAGIYELTYVGGKPAWTQRVKDNFAGSMLVSPDGCRVVYADSERRLRLLSAGSCR